MPLPISTYETVEELKRAALRAAQDVVREHYNAGATTWELAVSGRFAIHLSRQPIMLLLEREGILTEPQYPNMGLEKDPKAAPLANGQGPEEIRPDIIVHKRGHQGPNCLAIELKLAGGVAHVPPLDARDANKLRALTQPGLGFEYALGLWFALPRRPGHLGYFAEFRGGQLLQDVMKIPDNP